MIAFNPGDKVISDRYGPGVVTGESRVLDGVKVDFKGGPTDNVYHFMTGKRVPKCGNDVITKVEESE